MVSRKVQDRFFAKDFQPEIDATPDNGIFDLAVDSTTSSKVWFADKAYGMAIDIKNFVNSNISESVFVESMVEKVFGFVSKAVIVVTVCALGVGNIL